MKKYLLSITIMSIFWNCSDNQAPSQLDYANENCQYKVDVSKWRNEILEVDSLIIDGSIPFLATKEEVIAKFGQPDRINVIDNQLTHLNNYDRSKSAEVVDLLFGSSIFESKGSLAIFKIIDFESTNIELIHPKVNLREGLRINEICRLFPESCKLILLAGNTWSGHIELRTSREALDTRRIYLIFRNEKLVRVELHSFSI